MEEALTVSRSTIFRDCIKRKSDARGTTVLSVVRYSILITTFNAMKTIERCMNSVLSQIDSDFEVVVIDSYSTDGTLEFLKSIAEKGEIRLITAKCNRGEGRQMALEQARGKYVIAKVDTDAIYKPLLRTIAEFYEEKEKEIGEFVLCCGVIVSSKSFLMRVGGWKPLQWGENYELYKRLIDSGDVYMWRVDVSYDHLKFKTSFLQRARTLFQNYRDSLRMGLRPQVVSEEIRHKHDPINVLSRLTMLSIAWFASRFYERYGTFERVTWKEMYGDGIYHDSLRLFEDLHPDKVLTFEGKNAVK
jgi:glycosyltransferase involved in cell wall biosynthesis